jgi:hypothetical protein
LDNRSPGNLANRRRYSFSRSRNTNGRLSYGVVLMVLLLQTGATEEYNGYNLDNWRTNLSTAKHDLSGGAGIQTAACMLLVELEYISYWFYKRATEDI